MRQPRKPIPYAYTPIPNRFIEEWPASLGHAELRVYLSIMRLTWGFGKPSDALSITQIVKTSQLSRATVNRALKALREAGLLTMAGTPRKAKVCEIQFPRNLKITRLTALTLVKSSLGS